MASIHLSERALKRVLKEALAETLEEQHDLLRDVFVDVLEDFALGQAIREGRKTKIVGRDEVFRVLQVKQ